KEPCNECSACLGILDGTISDVIEIDAASNTSVDDIRDIRDKVKYAPSSVPYKVYIIDEVHMISVNAFNALLKTLEEPPEHVVFILEQPNHIKYHSPLFQDVSDLILNQSEVKLSLNVCKKLLKKKK